MKKIFYCLICLITFSASAQQNERKEFNSVIKFSPFQFMYNTFQLGYEKKLKPASSFVVNVGICYAEKDNQYKEGYIGEFQYRYYPLHQESFKDQNMRYLYFAPYANYKYFNIEETQTEYLPYPNYGTVETTQSERFSSCSVGVVAGINSIIGKRFHLDIYFGGGIRLSDSKFYDEDIFDPGYKGVSPKIGVEFGLNF